MRALLSPTTITRSLPKILGGMSPSITSLNQTVNLRQALLKAIPVKDLCFRESFFGFTFLEATES